MGRWLILVRSANDQAMAQVAACNQRYSSIDGFSGFFDGSPKSEMFIVRLIGETDHHRAPAPAGFVKIIQRHQRSMIERIVAAHPSQLDALGLSSQFDRVQHLEVIEKRKLYIGRVKVTKVTGELGG